MTDIVASDGPQVGIELSRPDPAVLEVSGGSGKDAWRMRFGSRPDISAHVASGEEGRAWFSHGPWLRQVDVAKGIVTGRWRFPGDIVKLTPSDTKVEVKLDLGKHAESHFQPVLMFDPAAPRIPEWPVGWLMLYRVSATEQTVFPVGESTGVPVTEIAREKALSMLGPVEEAMRRDPQSPWWPVTRARLLLAAGDPQAEVAFRETVQSAPADYAELFPLASHLDHLGRHDDARLAFERGYQDFWQRGYDPRLFGALIGRLILYRTPSAEKMTEDERREQVERIYKLSPGGEAAFIAWPLYADYLEQKGQAAEAQVWRSRAEEGGKFIDLTPWPYIGVTLDRSILASLGGFWALIAIIVILSFRYHPQRRLDIAARRQAGHKVRFFRHTQEEYFSRKQRIAIFALVLVLWTAAGASRVFAESILRMFAMPVGMAMGSFAGPLNTWYLENKLPATPERDLLAAMARQHSGEREAAERMYHGLPQFAQSWNNLGALLKEAGKDDEARQAFEKALALDPALAEAALNLGQPASTLWTELHQRYVPDRPMLAVPSREQGLRAIVGGSREQLYVRSLAGPFAGANVARIANLPAFVGVDPPGVMVFLMVMAFGLLFVARHREVTQPPGRRHWIWELLAPGTSPRWGVLGGVALAAWFYLVLQCICMMGLGTPYLLLGVAVPNLSRAYLVPNADAAAVLRFLNPSWLWIYAAPALLFLLNLVLVLRGRKAERG